MAKKIAYAIKEVYGLWRQGELERQFNLEPTKEHSWESQAKKLENVIRNGVKF